MTKRATNTMELLELLPIAIPLSKRKTDGLPKRVLVVEDDVDYQGLLASVLAQCDGSFHLEAVRTLSGALKAIERGRRS